jgi:putative ABC transport system permease protein
VTAARTFISRLRLFANRRRRDAALAEEIECHLDLLAAEFRDRGLSDREAHVAARRQFGSVGRVKESAREEQGFPLLESIWQDVTFGLRQLRRTPTFTLAAVLTLAIGIGGTVGIFSVLDVVAFRSLSYPDADRLVVIHEGLPTFGPFPASAADAEFWQAHTSSFETIALVNPTFMNLTGGGEPERLPVGRVAPSFLPMLSATPRMGRLFDDSEAVPGADNVIVLSEAFWRRRFGADPSMVGKSISLDGIPHQVIGVVGDAFRAPNLRHLYSIPVAEMVMQAWKPLALATDEKQPIGGYNYPAVTRLRPGISMERAQQDLDHAQAALLRAVPGKQNLYARIVPLQAQLASRSRPTLLLLFGATAAVLLIGCVNTTNLLSARMLARRREIAVRAAIGAGRWRIVRQVLVENLVLGAVGGVAGVVVGMLVLRTIVSLAPSDVPRLDEVALNSRVLLFAAAVSVGCGLLIGAPAAWRLGAGNLHASLATRGDESGVASGSYSLLVVAEIALCAASVGVAVLLAQSFAELNGVEKGFESSRMLTAPLNLTGSRYETTEAQAALFDSVADDVRSAPGVAAVTVSTQLPLTGTGALSALTVEGTALEPTQRPSADVRSVSVDYFRALGVPLTQGRLLDEGDRERRVAVLSEELAARGWPGQNPIGRKFKFGTRASADTYEVVGVVRDVRGTALDQPVTPTAYVPFPQRVRGAATLIVKTNGDPLAVSGVVRQSLRAHDPELPLPAFRTMEQVIATSLDARRFQLMVVGVFAGLAVLLAAIGVYGVMAYSVAQRRIELGVRLALGAAPVKVLLLVIGRAVRLGVAGVLLAVPVGWLTGAALHSFLYGVTPLDMQVFATTALVMFSVAVGAAAVPAIRASRLDPGAALRHE